MAYPGTYNFNYYEGDTYEFNIYPKNSDGSAFDMSNWSAQFWIATQRGNPDGVLRYECSAIIDGSKVACKIPPGKGRELTAGIPYVYDVEIRRTADGATHTLLTGDITVKADVSGAS
jgi:hypothetical protein